MTKLTETNLVSDFEYDDNSNLTKVKLNNVDNETFEYDVRNQLTKYAGIGNGIAVDFDYDFERKRLSKTVANVRRDYVYAGYQIINEYVTANSNINLNASYSIGAGEIVRSEFAGEGTRNYFSDALGSITSLADSAGSLVNRNDYDAFGEIISTSGNSQNAIGYTGQRLDAESGLMALGNGERYYNPSYGRFIQQDSFAGMPDLPQSLNRFAYTYNNPLSFVDPSGNIAENNRGSLANSARNYGLDPNGNNNWWNITKNFVARSGYDLWDTVSLGTLSREEENMSAWEAGEITTEQARWNTFKNGSLAAAKVGLMVATAGTGNALLAGAGLATRIGGGAALGVAEQFGNDLLEMGFGYRDEFSSAGNYAIAGIMGGVFGAASPGKAATTYAKEGKLTLGTELKLLGQEAKALSRTTGQIAKAFGQGLRKPTSSNMNMLGLQDVAQKLSNGIKNVKSGRVSQDKHPSYETPYKTLNAKQKTGINDKIKSRTATREEYKLLEWNRRFNNRRNRGVNRFWAREIKSIKEGKPTTRSYTRSQRQEMLNGDKPTFNGRVLEAHHRYNAVDYPQLADKPWNLYPVTRSEHLYRWHGGNFRNETSGRPLNQNYEEEF